MSLQGFIEDHKGRRNGKMSNGRIDASALLDQAGLSIVLEEDGNFEIKIGDKGMHGDVRGRTVIKGTLFQNGYQLTDVEHYGSGGVREYFFASDREKHGIANTY